MSAITVWVHKYYGSNRVLAVAWFMLFFILSAGWFVVQDAGIRERDRMQSRIEGLAPTYAHAIAEMGHAAITTSTPADDPKYLEMIEQQKVWLKLNPVIADIYTFRKHPDGNELIVDSETDYDRNRRIEGEREQRTPIGEIWAEKDSFLETAFRGEPSFDGTPYTDRWGTWVSSYNPMFDEDGHVEAVLGVDFFADDWVSAVARARLLAIGFIGVIVTIGLASTSIIAILQSNIVERRLSEMRIRNVAKRTRLIIDTAYEAFIAIDRDGLIIDWNSQAEQTFGWSKDEAIGQPIVDIAIPPQFREAHQTGLRRYLKTGEQKVLNKLLELRALRKDGTEIPIELTITPMLLDGECTFFAFLHDISERKQTETELRNAKDTAEAATKAKSEFLANMSHEIRTPMNGIIGMSELLANTDLELQQRDYLSMVQLSANSLLRLLNDILDFSKIEAGKLELETVDFSLRDCVAMAGQTLASRAADKGLELACRIDPDLPDRFIGDPGRLGQVLVNLVGNAVKFTDHGEVVIEVTGKQDTNGDALLHFAVQDTGVGIPQEKQDKIFSVFSQADASTTRRFGGTGLGLTISRQLVEMMGGKIEVRSKLGHGSTFFFSATFPLQTKSTQRTSKDISQLAGMPVLIVDDNKTNRCIFEEIFKSWKMQPSISCDGFSALTDLKRAADAGHPYELVLLDCMMPEMDGFQLASRIRQDPTLTNCTLVMASSSAGADDAEKCRQLGIARYMLKPVVQSELLDTILDTIDQPSTMESLSHSTNQGETPASKSLDILLVEDGLINQKVAVGLLEGHSVAIANNGQEAVDSIINGKQFDIILMDVQMPVMDGFEATSFIRNHEQPNGEHTPIIAMTASAMKGDREQCLAAGMDGYISKPITADELYEVIDEFSVAPPADALDPDEQNKFCVDSANTSPSHAASSYRITKLDDTAVNSSTDQLPKKTNQSVVDWDVALKVVDGDRQLLITVIEAVFEECPQLIQQLEKAISQKDYSTVQRAAHTIKGSFRTFGAKGVETLAEQLEGMGRTESLDGSLLTFNALQTQLEGVLTNLSDYCASNNSACTSRTNPETYEA